MQRKSKQQRIEEIIKVPHTLFEAMDAQIFADFTNTQAPEWATKMLDNFSRALPDEPELD